VSAIAIRVASVFLARGWQTSPRELVSMKQTEKEKSMLRRHLLHEKLSVRFGVLWGMVMLFFLGAWTLSYWLLPEGILQGRTAAQVLAGTDLAGGSVWLEWLRISVLNLGVMFLVVVAPNVFRTGRDYPLGYVTVTLIAAVFGIILGTNSFTVSVGGKLAPTTAVLGSSGFYEISAYVLAAAATAWISKYRLSGKWPNQKIETILPPRFESVLRERNWGILLAVVILLIANGWEAYRFSLAIVP
jgi:hypothetical protein